MPDSGITSDSGGRLRLRRASVAGDVDQSGIGPLDRGDVGQDLAPGEYVLQVRVTDKLGKPKQNIVSQYIDFEVTKPAPKAAPR